jgi:hypothetical protein
MLFMACLYDKWRNKEDQIVYSFTVLVRIILNKKDDRTKERIYS